MATSSDTTRRIQARYVFPISDKPIAGGVVAIRGERIAEVEQRNGRSGAVDLGNVAILPGFVNAHTHLEFSALAQPLGERGIRLPDWIRRLIAWRIRHSGYVASGTKEGLQESARLGTTTLGEIAQTDWPCEAFERAHLRSTVLLELIAPRPDSVQGAIQRAGQHLQQRFRGLLPGLSPHAPYSVRPELLEQAVSLCAARRAPLAFHLAESPEELELLRTGAGPLSDFLQELDSWDASVVNPPSRPLDYLYRLAAADRVLVAHGNYLIRDEIELIAEHRDHMSVVYCPRTHEHFGHDAYPLPQMLAAGAPVCLGTDSRASSPDLSVLAEMRAVRRKHEAVDPRIILEMGTLRGAKSLGLGAEIGSLLPGKFADLAIVALPDRSVSDPHELLLDCELPVVATWYRGDQVFRAPE